MGYTDRVISDLLRKSIFDCCKALGLPEVDFSLEHPREFAHGDYASNIALIIAKKINEDPREVAEKIAAELRQKSIPDVERTEVAPAGFINFHLSRSFFSEGIKAILDAPDAYGKNALFAGKRVMVEYTDPNPFKEFHIGHLMPNVIGESIARLLEHSGADVKRANYQGDVGLHVAKAVYGMQKSGTASFTPKSLGEAYALGAKAYEEDEQAKSEVNAVNKKIYDRSDSEINRLYDLGRKMSLDEFEQMYCLLDTTFDEYFFESETGPIGKRIVEEGLAHGVFGKSDGAVVFRGEKHGFHTRVFLNSEALPTYEAKDLGLARLKYERSPFDLSITVTANEQTEYFKVVLVALREVDPELASKIFHIGHGMMRLPSGKMSSRTGNLVTAEALIDAVVQKVREKLSDRVAVKREETVNDIAVGAVKYSILRQNIGGDIIFDFDKSISFEGDSGPYLQYAHVRAAAVARKAAEVHLVPSVSNSSTDVSVLERLIVRFPEAVLRSVREYEPHHLVTYLTELAGVFNGWYAVERIVEDTPQAPYKLALSEAFRITMARGLSLLGIKAPMEM